MGRLNSTTRGVTLLSPEVTVRALSSRFLTRSRGSGSERTREITRGRQIFLDSAPIAGNRLSCDSCHLDGGTNPKVLSLVGVAQTFPRMSRRYHVWMNLSQRIDRCVSNSLAGRPLAAKSQKLRELTLYVTALSADQPKTIPRSRMARSSTQSGRGQVVINNGAWLYRMDCAYCHGPGGQGFAHGSLAPPLWGSQSYTQQAGFDRLEVLSAFIRVAMPASPWHGIQPGQLSSRQSEQIARFLLDHARPLKGP